MTHQSLIYGLWFAGMALQATLGAVLLVKRIWAKFPIFTAYSLVNFLETVVLYTLRLQKHPYLYTYWFFQFVSLLLGLGVVYEIFAYLFSLHPALRTVATRVFGVTLAILVLLACLLIYVQMPARETGITHAIWVVEEAVRTLELGLTLFLLVFSSVLGLHWRQSAFGIVLGLGLFAAVDLTSVMIMSHVDISAARIFSLFPMVAFNLSLIVWIGYLVAPERAVTGELPKREQLEQWNQAVMELIGQ